jgi:SH3 domain protein
MDRYLFLQRSVTTKSLAVALMGLLLGPSISADEVYIHDKLYVPLRSAPSANAPAATSSLASGTKLDLISEEAESPFVRVVYTDSEGKSVEGFIHRQYLSKERIAADQLSDLANEKAAIAAEVQQLREDFATLDAAYTKLALRHEQDLERLSASKEETQRLTVLSQSAAQLESERVRLTQQNALLIEEIDALRRTESTHQADIEQRWYLIGGGSTVVMVVIGFLLGRRIYHRRYAGGWS